VRLGLDRRRAISEGLRAAAESRAARLAREREARKRLEERKAQDESEGDEVARKPVSYCVEAGCRAKAVRGGRCGAHAREAWGGASRREGTTTERGYGAVHRRRRAAELAAEPWCYVCGVEPAVAIDHVLPLAQGGDDTDENRMPICRSCHSAKTQWETRHAWEFAGSSGRHKIDKVRQTIKKRGGF